MNQEKNPLSNDVCQLDSRENRVITEVSISLLKVCVGIDQFNGYQ